MTEKRALDFELGCLVQGNMQSTQSFKKKLALRW